MGRLTRILGQVQTSRNHWFCRARGFCQAPQSLEGASTPCKPPPTKVSTRSPSSASKLADMEMRNLATQGKGAPKSCCLTEGEVGECSSCLPGRRFYRQLDSGPKPNFNIDRPPVEVPPFLRKLRIWQRECQSPMSGQAVLWSWTPPPIFCGHSMNGRDVTWSEVL